MVKKRIRARWGRFFRSIVTGIVAGIVFWTLFVATSHIAVDQYWKGAQWAAAQCLKETGAVIEGVRLEDITL